jgi:cysteine desulfurase
MIYFDNNATTRVFEGVADAIRPYLTEQFANPASAMGQFGGVSRDIAVAKSILAETLGADSGDQIVITSGATEANNLALLGAARANPRRRHLITSVIEHPSVLEVMAFMESTGYLVTRIPVTADGLVSPKEVRLALTADTLLVSVMLANNETGVIQPVGEIARLVKAHDTAILVHSDATQAVGKIPIDLGDDLSAVDLLSFSAHKFHGPKGVGALFVREANAIAPLFFGGGQQFGLRPGTENPALIIGMKAALVGLTSAQEPYLAVSRLRDEIQRRILSLHAGAFALGVSRPRLPNTLSLCLPGIEGADLVDSLANLGIAISTGSACAQGANKPSYVMLAMGLSHAQAGRCIRISLSIETTQFDVESLMDAISSLFTSNISAI